jgi:hypothetical protein
MPEMNSSLPEPLSASPPPGFDPAKGAQALSTGMLGGLFIAGHAAFYALFNKNVFGPVGPAVADCLRWLPAPFRCEFINRDFFDVLFIVLLGLQFMIVWEFWKHWVVRSALVTVSATTLLGAWYIAGGVDWFFDGTWQFLGWPWTRMEIVYAAQFVAVSALAAPTVLRRMNSSRIERPWKVLWTAFCRWAAGLLLFTAVLWVVGSHPFYSDGYYENWRLVCSYLWTAYAILGLPYSVATNWLRRNRGENLRDPGFMLLLIFRRLAMVAAGNGRRRLGTVLRNRKTRVVLLDLLVKLFFIPLMATFLFAEFGNLRRNLPALLQSIHDVGVAWPSRFDLSYWTIFHLIILVDVSIALIGYAASSRWLGNKSVSVEQTVGGWAVALACYPPFNGLTTDLLPYNRSGPGAAFLDLQQFRWIDAENAVLLNGGLDVALRCVALAGMMLYVWATLSFGMRFSNLTHRGIITRGPYALMRHPAYFGKNVAWWAESVRSFTSPWQPLFLAGWNIIYFLRAWTEERHLRKFADYRAYCERVKYRFIPGVW